MLNKSTILTYPLLAIMSIGKKSFENLGRAIKISGHTVARLLQPHDSSFEVTHSICKSIFSSKNILYLIIDDTLIKKIFALNMRGTGMFYDTKIGRCINAFRLVTAMLSDGRYTIPIGCAYLFSKEIMDLCSEKFPSKSEICKRLFEMAKKIFPDIKIRLVADGLYSSIELVEWCVIQKIQAEMRMHSNRVVTYNGVKKKLCDFANMPSTKLKGKQMARTISVEWHGLPVEITIVKRIDKHGEESIVYQVATYKAEPREHVKTYNVRWNTEMFNRTAKQSLGLGDCYSNNLAVQYNHVAAVSLAYALAQQEMKRGHYKTPEDAIRALKGKFDPTTFYQFIEQHSFSPPYHA